MSPALLAAAATGLTLAACATPRSVADEHYYHCRVERAEGPGTLTLIIDVEQDGRRQDHHFRWVRQPPRDGAQVRIEWIHVLPLTPADDLMVTFTVRRTWRARFARLVLSRSEGSADGLQSRTITGPTYGRDIPSASVTVALSHLRDFLRGAPSLTVGVVDANGRLLTQERIESSMFDTAARAIAAAQPQIEAMAADYRNRCELTEPDRIMLT